MNTSLYIPEEWKEAWKRARAESHKRSYDEGRNVPVAEILLENYKTEAKKGKVKK